MRGLHRMHCLLLVLEVLRKRSVMHMWVYVVVEVVREGRVSMVVVKVVVHHGMPHRVVVVVMVMVRGPKRRDPHRRGAHRWGHWEQVGPKRVPHPSRCRSCRLPSTLRFLRLPIVHLEVVEQLVEDGDPKGCRARREQHVHVRRVKWRGVVDQHSSQAEADDIHTYIHNHNHNHNHLSSLL